MATKGQFNFSNGVIAPELRARIDVAGYYASLAGGKNCHVMRSGGVVNRAGTGLVGKVTFDSQLEDDEKVVRLIPFIETDEESYVLEFTQGRLRILRNGAYVMRKDDDGDDTSDIFEITEGVEYLSGDLVKIKYDQKHSFMTLVHSNRSPKQIKYDLSEENPFSLIGYHKKSENTDSIKQTSIKVWLPYASLTVLTVLIFILKAVIFMLWITKLLI